jgi:hypothetical protein
MANCRIGGRDHSLLARQLRSKPRRCHRSRESAFYRSGTTPCPHLPPCFGDYCTHRHRCVFQSGPQTTCFTPAHGSESGQSQTPGGNGRFALAQGRQSRSSQAPVADRSEALRARPWTENPPAARPERQRRFIRPSSDAAASHATRAVRGGESD